MKINLEKIFEQQINLDKVIHQTHNIEYKNVLDELKLALKVELAELANEIRCFKFWSLKNRSDDNTILMELVDCIHFITSLSLAYGGSRILSIDDNLTHEIQEKKLLTIIINSLFDKTVNLNTANQIDEWYKKVIILAYNIGYNFEDIMKAYEEKNKVNHERQKNKY